MWPREESDFMEMGNTGWVLAADGWYLNKHNGHTMDDIGREYDASGQLIFDPNPKED